MSVPPVPIQYDVPLAPLTTLQLGGLAKALAEVSIEEELWALLTWAKEQDWPTLIMGAGSNVVVGDAGFDGLVIRWVAATMVFPEGMDGGPIWVDGGVTWDVFVEASVKAGWTGLECLSGIPGTVGATPIQNVGAYGAEVGTLIEEVELLDRDNGQRRRWGAKDCRFGYRHSRFKEERDRWVVLRVAFRLGRGSPAIVHHPQLQEALQGKRLHPQPIREAVLRLRAQKSMVISPNDPNHRSVGSFFVNPIVPVPQAQEVIRIALADGLVESAEEVPQYATVPNQGIKLSAAWLIERSGFHKGLVHGAVGISGRHALALVHHGGGTTEDLLHLAKDIRQGVYDRWGMTLELEPTLVNCSIESMDTAKTT
ncbi:MAG: UDP-N-acetylmuramate dehydrogenase [Myxococcales bacterium]|nr:UDP-N-acetylmuramate dehydrogenase [Myxococcales bacterium]